MGGKNKQKKQQGRGTKARKIKTYGKPKNGALKSGSAFTNSNASTKLGRRGKEVNEFKSGSRMRSTSTIKRLNMYKKKAPKMEELIKQSLQPKRVEPDRRWFGNTRVITQKKMEDFRTELSKTVDDPFSVVLKNSKLPLSLLQDSTKDKRMDLLAIESYDHTFGPKKQRKRPRLASYDLEAFVAKTHEKEKAYDEMKDSDLGFNIQSGEKKATELKHSKEEIFDKGTSKRIWGELYKVVDSSDVLIQVIDARDPMGTRCMKLEREVKKNHPNKRIVLLLNKVDLVPTWVTKRWVEVLRKEFPTVAFHASITNPFGKSALIQLLRQLLSLMKDRKHVSVGFIGYPNVGKSSAINALRKKKVCKAAPIPGETKVWQYIKITSKLYAVDCPGIVPAVKADFEHDCAKVLKGVVRLERIKDPSNYVDEVLSRVKPCYIFEKYNLPSSTTWNDGEEFLTILSRKMGKLLKGGDPDIEATGRIVLQDWQKGRLAYFMPPPEREESDEDKRKKSKDATNANKEDGEVCTEAEKIKVLELQEKDFKDLKCTVNFDAEDMREDQIVVRKVQQINAPEHLKGINDPATSRNVDAATVSLDAGKEKKEGNKENEKMDKTEAETNCVLITNEAADLKTNSSIVVERTSKKKKRRRAEMEKEMAKTVKEQEAKTDVVSMNAVEINWDAIAQENGE